MKHLKTFDNFQILPIDKEFSDFILDYKQTEINGLVFKFLFLNDNSIIIENELDGEIGKASLNSEGYLNNIRIDSKYRRIGLATKIYDYIEELIGKKLKPSLIKQSQEIKKFWDKRNLKESTSNNINVYYHGSKYYFDNFCNDNKDISDKTGGDEYSYGTYLTPHKNIASHYAKNTHYLYTVKLKNKLNFLSDAKKVSKTNLEKIRNMFIINEFEDTKGNKMSNEHKLFIINNIIKDSKNGLDLYNKILRIFPISDKQLSEMLENSGINGLIGNEETEIIIYNPLNIEIISIEKLS